MSLAFVIPAANAASMWNATMNYPVNIAGGSCVANAGYIYCVTGETTTSTSTTNVEYAKLAGGKVGAWIATAPYVAPVVLESCVVSGGYITCVGGHFGSTEYAEVWSAHLTAAGVGTWVQTLSYGAILCL